MIYTFQRRRALNKVVRAMFPGMKFEENTDGVPVLRTYKLPDSAVQVIEISELLRLVDENCSINECGIRRPDPKSVLPVFIKGYDISEMKERVYWRVNYVSCTEHSKRKAAQYVEEGRLLICCRSLFTNKL